MGKAITITRTELTADDLRAAAAKNRYVGTVRRLLGKRQPIPALLFRVQVGLVWDGLKFHGNSASSALLRWPFAMRSITAAI